MDNTNRRIIIYIIFALILIKLLIFISIQVQRHDNPDLQVDIKNRFWNHITEACEKQNKIPALEEKNLPDGTVYLSIQCRDED